MERPSINRSVDPSPKSNENEKSSDSHWGACELPLWQSTQVCSAWGRIEGDPLTEAPSQGTGCGTRSYSAMRHPRDIELIFPIKDAVSADLMVIKADCLHKAGKISDREKQWVNSRAGTFLLNDAA